MGLTDVEVDVEIPAAVMHPAHQVVEVGVTGFGVHDRPDRSFVSEEVVNRGEPLQERCPCARLLHSTLVRMVPSAFTDKVVGTDEPVHGLANGRYLEDVVCASRELGRWTVTAREDTNGCAKACAQRPALTLEALALKVVGRKNLFNGRTSGFGHVNEVDVDSVAVVVV